ncbi:hypothetical protein ACF0H5_015775 [Mactra antiquata]
MDNFIYCFALFGLLLCKQTVEGYTAYHASKLQTDLLSNYSAKVRPNDTTTVSLEFGMMHITELNIVTQTLHCIGFLIALWEDDRLQWDPTNYDNMTESFIPLSDVWSPPLLLNNAADEIKIMNDDSDLSSLNVYLFSSGYVVYLAPTNFLAQCSINIKYYPFDSQSCHIVVSSWLFLNNHIRLISTTTTSINLDIYEDNGEWDIIKSSVKNITRVLSGHHLPAVQFTIHLARKYSYYLLNMLLPVIILAVMAPFVFMLPPASGEKIGYALTILLSLSVVMTLVSDNIPPTSTHTCILSVYLLLTFMICSLETVLTVWTCRIHDSCGKDYVMGSKLQKVAKILATVTAYRRPCEQEKLPKNVVSSVNDVKMIENMDGDKGTKHKTWNEESENYDHTKHTNNHDVPYTPEELTNLFDRFNFWLFSIVTVIVTVCMMIILEVGGKADA